MKTLKFLALSFACLLTFHASLVYAEGRYIHESNAQFAVLFFPIISIFFWALFRFAKEKRELKSTLQSVPDLLFKFDIDGNYLEVYTDKPSKLAAPADEVIGRNVKDILPIEAANVVMDSLQAAAKLGFDFGRTIELSVPDGRRYFELSVSRKEDPADHSVFFSMISRDFTDRKNYEKEIERARAVSEDLSKFLSERTRLLEVEVETRAKELSEAWQVAREEEIKRRKKRLVLENIPIPTAINNLDGSKQITFINKAFTDVFGYAHEDIPTLDDWANKAYPNKPYREEVFTWWNKAVQDYLEKGIAMPERDFHVQTKSGQRLIVSITARLVEKDLIVTLLDVTKVRQARELLEKQSLDKVNSALKKIELTEAKMLKSLNALAMARDNETGKHILRTQHYVKCIALRLRAMGNFVDELDDRNINLLFLAAPLHDVGKVGIPDKILHKPGPLTLQERLVMKAHTTLGEAILSSADSDFAEDDVLKMAVQIAGGHHEKWDGSGYPRSLKGDEIPLAARIMALADVYDALVSARVYKEEWTHEAAVAEIIAGKGAHFDPRVVDAFVAAEAEFRSIADEYRDD